MKKLDLNQTIGESVALHPELAGVYMDHGVDFCCGGDRTVEEAVQRDARDAARLLEEAEKAMEAAQQLEADSQKMPLSDFTTKQLIDRIVNKHHSFLKKELPVMANLMAAVLAAHGRNHPELFDIHKLFGSLKTELESHLAKEELLLFPKLLSEDAARRELIEELEAEHDAAGDALHQLTDLTGHFTPPADACPSYTLLYEKFKAFAADMYLHVHAENSILFKRF